ncbi:MAG: ribosome small subunit-dependent GTPase A [Bacteroidia bacterium]|nr:ribosome small subunit-dependent GTPase A [Bacteroidia bacterium]
MKKGLVIKSTGSRYSVKSEEGISIECIISGKLRKKDIKITNPIAVGDNVLFENENQMGVIKEILPRKNYIIRKSSNLSKQAHIIAANVDMAILIITVRYPKTLTTFIDRFLVTAEAYRIPAVLLFNKTDLFNEDEMEYLHALADVYERAGYKCLKISVKDNINIDEVKNLMKGKISVVAGYSGVGKSSLINCIDPSVDLKICDISESHLKGKHTTTFYQMYELSSGGYIIDTPGIKGFGIIDLFKNEIYHFFPEFFRLSEKCQYYNCTHLHEPNCAVKDALEKGEVSETRYNSYLSILEGDDDKHRE